MIGITLFCCDRHEESNEDHKLSEKIISKCLTFFSDTIFSKKMTNPYFGSEDSIFKKRYIYFYDGKVCGISGDLTSTYWDRRQEEADWGKVKEGKDSVYLKEEGGYIDTVRNFEVVDSSNYDLDVPEKIMKMSWEKYKRLSEYENFKKNAKFIFIKNPVESQFSYLVEMKLVDGNMKKSIDINICVDKEGMRVLGFKHLGRTYIKEFERCDVPDYYQ